VDTLRTPDERFSNLPDFNFASNYVDIDGMRMHYVDEGPPDGEAILLLHGEPSWSFLYRHMIPPLADAGLRAIAPDLIGFGKSDKPSAQSAYTYEAHVAWMRQFIEALNLTGITLVCQDWGSLIGLRVAAENEQRFARIVLANGGLPTGDQEMPRAFRLWRAFASYSPWFPIGRILQSAICRNKRLCTAQRADVWVAMQKYCKRQQALCESNCSSNALRLLQCCRIAACSTQRHRMSTTQNSMPAGSYARNSC